MLSIDELPPYVQLLIRYFGNDSLSYQDLGREEDVSKETIRKRFERVFKYLQDYGQEEKIISPSKEEIQKLEAELHRKNEIISKLQLQLIFHKLTIIIFTSFKERVLKFFPTFKAPRLSAHHKMLILNLWWKYKNFGGTLKDFSSHIGKSPRTIERWIKAYEENGISGLQDKTTRPKHFGNKVTKRIRDFLVGLFLRFPSWTPFQYHRHLRFHPETSYYVSIPTIQKFKRMHTERSLEEKERIKKRWAFNQGTDAWTMDFTSLYKTPNINLQLLTISDHRSRFLFKTALFLTTSTDLVMNHLQELFLKYGRPTIIKVDNGPEFRTDCEEKLRELSIYLLNSPFYYGQFNGAHERIHRTLKTFVDPFLSHGNLTRLVEEILVFEKEYNYEMKSEYLEDRTPADVFFYDKSFVPKNVEVVTPYSKDEKLKINFTNRTATHGQLSRPLIPVQP
jgi:transposase InsO family protein/transposase-like protein